MGRIRMQLEMIEERAARAQDGRVLLRRDAAEFTRADIAGSAAEQLRFVLQAVAQNEGVVDDDVASVGVFDEKGHVRRFVEKLFEQRHIHGPDVRLGERPLHCARFHKSASV